MSQDLCLLCVDQHREREWLLPVWARYIVMAIWVLFWGCCIIYSFVLLTTLEGYLKLLCVPVPMVSVLGLFSSLAIQERLFSPHNFLFHFRDKHGTFHTHKTNYGGTKETDGKRSLYGAVGRVLCERLRPGGSVDIIHDVESAGWQVTPSLQGWHGRFDVHQKGWNESLHCLNAKDVVALINGLPLEVDFISTIVNSGTTPEDREALFASQIELVQAVAVAIDKKSTRPNRMVERLRKALIQHLLFSSKESLKNLYEKIREDEIEGVSEKAREYLLGEIGTHLGYAVAMNIDLINQIAITVTNQENHTTL